MPPIRQPMSSINERLAVLERAVEEHDDAVGRLAAELSEVREGISEVNSKLAGLDATLAPMVKFYLEALSAPKNEASGVKVGVIVAVITVVLNVLAALVQAGMH